LLRPFNPLLESLPPVIKAGDPGAQRSQLDQPIYSICGGGSGWETCRQRLRSHQVEWVTVHRRRAPLSWSPSTGTRRLADGYGDLILARWSPSLRWAPNLFLPSWIYRYLSIPFAEAAVLVDAPL